MHARARRARLSQMHLCAIDHEHFRLAFHRIRKLMMTTTTVGNGRDDRNVRKLCKPKMSKISVSNISIADRLQAKTRNVPDLEFVIVCRWHPQRCDATLYHYDNDTKKHTPFRVMHFSVSLVVLSSSESYNLLLWMWNAPANGKMTTKRLSFVDEKDWNQWNRREFIQRYLSIWRN